MNLLNSSVIILLSIALAIPQNNHGDSAENTSSSSEISTAPVESISTSSGVTSIPVDTSSSSGDSFNTPNNTSSSSEEANSSTSESTIPLEIKENKLEDIFLSLGVPQGLANANFNVANVGRTQADVPRIGGTPNVKADSLGVGVGSNVGVDGYTYPPYYLPYYLVHYLPSYQSLKSKLPKPFRPSEPTNPSGIFGSNESSFRPHFFIFYE